MEVVQYIKENNHGGKCEVATIGWYLLIFLLLSPQSPPPPPLPFEGKDIPTANRSNAAEDGKFVGDSDVGEFWSLFGGFAPIPRDSPSSVQKQSDAPSVKLFWCVCLNHPGFKNAISISFGLHLKTQ